MKVAIVTGASAGLGVEFVKQIDAGFDIDEIWLVARRLEPMEKLARELTRAKGVPIVADLTTDEGISAVAGKLAQVRPELELLVNNAGFGLFGRFAEIDRDNQLKIIDLNIRALTHLTHVGLEYMGRGGIIIQVASLVGFFPACGLSVYAATKAYVVSFTSALAGELKDRGIKCVACCPGMMRTEFVDVASKYHQLFFYDIAKADPVKVAAAALAHGRQGKVISIKGFFLQIASLLTHLLPRSLFVRFTRRDLP
ncbi:MAG: SDR family NAD(P)-dependent oxidoreductase [Deltaproteobacteria bacterium]|nr:SDR family NAD(P)-dependent oxidoreductase [Deltaproteobacteria bacterium]